MSPNTSMDFYTKIFKTIMPILGKVIGTGMQKIHDKEKKEALQALMDELTSIDNELKQISSQLGHVLASIKLSTDDIKNTIHSVALDDAVSVIVNTYDEYRNLVANYNDTDQGDRVRKLAGNILSGNQQSMEYQAARIANAIKGNTADGTSALMAWTSKVIDQARFGVTDLNDSYLSLEGYFTNLVHYQLQACLLIVEAKNEQADPNNKPSDKVIDNIPYTADTYVRQVFMLNITQQVDCFLACVERLVAASIVDPLLVVRQGKTLIPPQASAILGRADFVAAQLSPETHPVGLIVRVVGEPLNVKILKDKFKSGPTPDSINYTLPQVPNSRSAQNDYEFDTYDTETFMPYTYTQWLTGWATKQNGVTYQGCEDKCVYVFAYASKIRIHKHVLSSPQIGKNYQFDIPYGPSATGTAQLLDRRMNPIQDTTNGVVYGSCLLTSFHTNVENIKNLGVTSFLQTDYSHHSATGSSKSLPPIGVEVRASGMTTSTAHVRIAAVFTLRCDYAWYEIAKLPKIRMWATMSWVGNNVKSLSCGATSTVLTYLGDQHTDEKDNTFRPKNQVDNQDKQFDLITTYKHARPLEIKLEVHVEDSTYQSTYKTSLNFAGSAKLHNVYLLPCDD